MDFVDASYLAAVTAVGCCARALVRGLPEGWRLRLCASVPELGPGWIWVQAVSVGELMLAEGILGRLRAAGHRVHVTTGTAAGLKLLEQRLPGWDKGTGRITGGAFPLDDPAGLADFLRQPPGAFIALETEIWPNLLRVLASRGIPACIVNGRLTGRSLGRGRAWMARAASRLSLVAARDADSALHFRELGAPMVVQGGNLKADLAPPRPLHPGWAPLRAAWDGLPVLVAGNTVETEEALVLAAWARARAAHPGLRLVLAPRQPRRFQAVAELLLGLGLRFRRGSGEWPEGPGPWADTEILCWTPWANWPQPTAKARWPWWAGAGPGRAGTTPWSRCAGACRPCWARVSRISRTWWRPCARPVWCGWCRRNSWHRRWPKL
jgi:3-deoxy-D-manno-octulosonic-acid transferase